MTDFILRSRGANRPWLARSRCFALARPAVAGGHLALLFLLPHPPP